MKIGDLVRTKSPFEPEVGLIVGYRVDIGVENFDVLASRTGKIYNLREDALEVVEHD